MLYVNNQDESLNFWIEKAHFTLIAEGNEGGIRWIEVAPTGDAATSIVLHNKAQIAAMEPELNLGTPSLMFLTDHIDRLYLDFKDNGISVGELVELPSGRVFNFADNEENYFAVMESK